MSLLGILAALLIVCLVVWAAQRLLTAFEIQEPIKTTLFVILVILVVLWAVAFLSGSGTMLPAKWKVW